MRKAVLASYYGIGLIFLLFHFIILFFSTKLYLGFAALSLWGTLGIIICITISFKRLSLAIRVTSLVIIIQLLALMFSYIILFQFKGY